MTNNEEEIKYIILKVHHDLFNKKFDVSKYTKEQVETTIKETISRIENEDSKINLNLIGFQYRPGVFFTEKAFKQTFQKMLLKEQRKEGRENKKL